jgi:hypothetical protein
MKRPGVHGVGVGYKLVKGEETQEVCVRVYVEKKLAEKEIDKEHLIPAELNDTGIKTDIIESGGFYVDDTEAPEDNRGTFDPDYSRYNPLKGGCMLTSSYAEAGSGTMGTVFYDKKNNRQLGLTNMHVVYNSGKYGLGGRILYQPSKSDTNKLGDSRLGYINEKIDAAIFSVDGRPATHDILDLGEWNGTAASNLGDVVRKRGMRTEFTQGKIVDNNLTAWVNYASAGRGELKFKDLMWIKPFKSTVWSFSGDSGSCIFNENMEMVGLHFARYREDEKIYPGGLACKISNVEESLDIEISSDYVDKGNFNTTEVRSWEKSQKQTSRKLTFAEPFTGTPGLPIGLNYIDMGHKDNIRLKAYASQLTNNDFVINIETWADSHLFAAGCSWLDIAPEETNIQFGTFNTTEDHPWTKHQKKTTKVITFTQSFSETPDVVVWLNAMDLSNKNNWQISAYPQNITKCGFEIVIESRYDTTIVFAEITWIAHPKGAANIASGTYSTEDVRSGTPQLKTENAIDFESPFTSTPRVITGLHTLGIDRTKNLRIKNTITDVTNTGMTWHLDGWHDTNIYYAGASYIAIL